jgi:glycosyltransferase involved in cell wall biosynthesis
MNTKISVIANGDPLSPKTWSGTPHNLCKELEKSSTLGDTFDFNAFRKNRVLNKILDVLSRLYYKSSFDISRGLFYRYAASFFLKKKIKKESNVLHTSSLGLPFLQQIKNGNHFLFCDCTWNLWQKNLSSNSYSKLLLKHADELEYKTYHQMKHIFPVGEYIKQDLITHYNIPPEKITVVGTGRGAIAPYFGKKNYTNGTIIFVAKDRFEDKGGHILLEAFKKAVGINPTLNLKIIGQDYYKDFIKDIPNVTVYGFVSLTDLQLFFEEASLYVMPAVNEPWGLVYLEALSCKTPVVGLNRNAFPEIAQYGQNGYILKEANANELFETIINCFNNPGELEIKGLKGQEYCLKTHTWGNVITKIRTVLDHE